MASAIILAKSSLNTTTLNYGPHYGSILQQSRITYKEFIKILAHFSNGLSVKTAAEQANLAENTVRRFFNSIHERIAEDVTTKTEIGGLGTVVEIDESKWWRGRGWYLVELNAKPITAF